mmetsp:Transcript_15003/g.37674  ORF Transcript_15003/g.37674 Transcript_15003/m.37674 type:complete len:214 (+) Transcript_15003:478-1119(+)
MDSAVAVARDSGELNSAPTSVSISSSPVFCACTSPRGEHGSSLEPSSSPSSVPYVAAWRISTIRAVVFRPAPERRGLPGDWFRRSTVTLTPPSASALGDMSSTVVAPLLCSKRRKYVGGIPRAVQIMAWLTALCATTSAVLNESGRLSICCQASDPRYQSSLTGACPSISNSAGAFCHCWNAAPKRLMPSSLSRPWKEWRSTSRRQGSTWTGP